MRHAFWKAMGALAVMLLFLLSGALGVGIAWAAMSLVFLLLASPVRDVAPASGAGVDRAQLDY
jgi:hypothetical protein